MLSSLCIQIQCLLLPHEQVYGIFLALEMTIIELLIHLKLLSTCLTRIGHTFLKGHGKF
jgi:hypothetical protein